MSVCLSACVCLPACLPRTCLPASKCGAAPRGVAKRRGKAGAQEGSQEGLRCCNAPRYRCLCKQEGETQGELRNRTTHSPFPLHQAPLPFISTICLSASPLSRGLFPSSPTHRAGPAMSCMLVLCALEGWGAQKHRRQRHNQIKSDQPLPSPSSKIRPIECPLLVLSRQSGKDSLDSA